MEREPLFEIARRTVDTPEFRGMTFIEVEAKSVINHVPAGPMPFSWTINPYRGCSHACVYCFARVTHTYMDMNAGHDFESKIVVKVNAPQVLRRELAARRWKGEHVAMGTATDPYQRAEGRYRLTREIVRALVDFRNPFSILTKGTLILRDVDLFREARAWDGVWTAFSIPTLDEDVWRRSEPGTPHPRARLEAVAELNRAGIPCGVMVAPILPGISDSRASLERVIRAAVAAGAPSVTPILLHLRPVVREEYMAWLGREYPDLVTSYEEVYARSPYLPAARRREVGRLVGSLARRAGLRREDRDGGRFAGRASEPRRPAPRQLKLL